MINRRGLITGLVSFVAAPAIVRASSLMPVKAIKQCILSDYNRLIPTLTPTVDVLYGRLKVGDCITIAGFDGEFTITYVPPEDFYADYL